MLKEVSAQHQQTLKCYLKKQFNSKNILKNKQQFKNNQIKQFKRLERIKKKQN